MKAVQRWRPRPPRARWAGLLLLLLVPAAPAQDEDRQQVAAAIRERIEAIEAARREHLERRAELRAEAERVEAVLAELAARRDRAAATKAELEERIAHAQAGVDAARAEADRRLAVVDAAAAAARPVALRLEEAVRRGIPHRREERAEAFLRLAAMLADGEGWETRAEGLRRLWAAVAQELQLAATREVRSESVDLGDGVSKHAYVARFGLVAEVFVTEDGEHAGIAAREPDREWRILEDRAQVQRLVAIVDCLRRRRQPEILALPIVVEEGS